MSDQNITQKKMSSTMSKMRPVLDIFKEGMARLPSRASLENRLLRKRERHQPLWERDCGYHFWANRQEQLRRMLEQLKRTFPDIDLARASAIADREGRRVDEVLVRLGIVPEGAVSACWANVLGCEVAESERSIDPSAIRVDVFSKDYVRGDTVFLLDQGRESISCFLSDPLDEISVSAASLLSGKSVRRILATDHELTKIREDIGTGDRALPESIDPRPDIVGDIERLRDLASDAPVVRAVAGMIEAAVDRKASDIHVTADGTRLAVRLRVDGTLETYPTPAVSLAAIVSRVKIMAGLDIGESRMPQDGRVRLPIRGRETDLRVATVPHVRGEGVVIRILDRSAVRLDLDELALNSAERGALDRIVGEPHGLVVVTGPTGSGKTTTLYSVLRALSSPTRNIVTVEDPVEVRLEGVGQIQVQPKIGLDFATTLRSVLRQDPDVIMVGEIRDRETAVVANQAALTGHLVVASLHTNTALGAIPRLVDMGIEPYLLASTLRASIAQRLVRRLCGECRKEVDLPISIWRNLASRMRPPPAEPMTVFAPGGCPTCRGTGYRGRFAVFEVVEIKDRIKSAIGESASEDLLDQLIDRQAHPPLARNALLAVERGLTSIDEVIRILGSG